MRVRDWLINTAAIDVLIEMHERLRRCDSKPCICTALFDYKRDDRCSRFSGNCKTCIEASLNDER